MLKNKTKSLGDRGYSHIEFAIVIVVLVAFLVIGVVVINKNGKSNAGSNNFQQLETVTWNPNKTAYYANSEFENFACVTQDSNTKQIKVTGIMLALDYTGYIKSGSYEPGVSIRLNGDNKTIQSFGNNWIVGSVQNTNGAYITFTTPLLPINTVYQASPLATNLWPSVWTSPVVVKNLMTCNGSALVLPEQTVTTLNGGMTNSSTDNTITVNSYKLFPLTTSFYIKIDNEIMLVTSGQGTNTWTVTRGVFSTPITSHLTSTLVQEYIPTT
jgi:hypothetical protein